MTKNPTEFENKFFGEPQFREKIEVLVNTRDFERMKELSIECHELLMQNIKKFRGPIEYVIIGEAAPFDAIDSSYIYHETPKNKMWRDQIGKAFDIGKSFDVQDEKTIDKLNSLGVLFIDLLPYCANYSNLREKEKYKKLVQCCIQKYLPWLINELRGNGADFLNPKVAFAMQSIGNSVLGHEENIKIITDLFGADCSHLKRKRWEEKEEEKFFDHIYKSGKNKICVAHPDYFMESGSKEKGEETHPAPKKSYYSIDKLSKFKQIAADRNGPKALLIKKAFDLDKKE